MYLPAKVHFKKKGQHKTYLMMFKRFLFVFLVFFIKAYIVGTNLNCINLELLDCALMGGTCM